MTLTATPTPFTIDPGMHPRIAQRIEHNLDTEAPLQTVTRVALAAQQARDLVASVTGCVIIDVRDEDGPVAKVALYSHDPHAYVSDGRTGWRFTVGEYEADELSDTYLRVVSHDHGEG